MKKRNVLVFITLTYISAAFMALLYWLIEMNQFVGNYGWDFETIGFSVVLTLALVGIGVIVFVWYNMIVLNKSIEIKVVDK